MHYPWQCPKCWFEAKTKEEVEAHMKEAHPKEYTLYANRTGAGQ